LGTAIRGHDLPSLALVPGWLQVLVDMPLSGIVYAFFLIFPSGRFVPRWSWALVPLWVCQTTLVDVSRLLHLDFPEWTALGYPLLFAGAVAVVVYRYRRVSTPVERLQTKWVAFGLSVALLTSQLGTWLVWLTPLSHTLFLPIADVISTILALAVPIALFI